MTAPLPRPSSHRIIGIAIMVIGFLCGCGGETAKVETQTVTVAPAPAPKHLGTPTMTDTPTMTEWNQQAVDSIENLGHALIAVGDAMEKDDFPAMRVACSDLRAASDALERELPSPDPALTAALQDGIDNFRSASQLCMTANPSTGQEELNSSINRYVDRGGTRMCDAYELMGVDDSCR